MFPTNALKQLPLRIPPCGPGSRKYSRISSWRQIVVKLQIEFLRHYVTSLCLPFALPVAGVQFVIVFMIRKFVVATSRVITGVMERQLQNAQTICGSRIGWDTENDNLMIVVTQRSWSPAPLNDQETVCWFEPYVPQPPPVSGYHLEIIHPDTYSSGKSYLVHIPTPIQSYK